METVVSLQPRSRSRCTKAAVHGPTTERVFGLKKPIVDSLRGCARAASGHAAIAPPISVMNSRRCIGAVYSITSSARATNVDGTSRPSVLAVLRLMTI
jgi:hypothetical protein